MEVKLGEAKNEKRETSIQQPATTRLYKFSEKTDYVFCQ